MAGTHMWHVNLDLLLIGCAAPFGILFLLQDFLGHHIGDYIPGAQVLVSQDTDCIPN